MNQITITKRQVFHKTAQITINVPDMSPDDVQVWLQENEDRYEPMLEWILTDTKLLPGFGLDVDNGMDDKESICETRFDFKENKKIVFGGHI
jgi:hypothetical protein